MDNDVVEPQNIKYITSAEESDLVDLLLHGFTSATKGKYGFDPLELDDKPSYVSQITSLYKHKDLEQDTRSKFKRALARAIVEWLPGSHGTEVLLNLIYLAENFRATNVVPFLRELFNDARLKFLSDTDYHKVVKAIISVLSGFAPSHHVLSFFEELYFDRMSKGNISNNRFDERYAAQLFIGLCRCYPDNYPKYLPVFFDILETKGETFFQRLDYIFAIFGREVSLNLFVSNLYRVQDSYLSQLFKYVCQNPLSPFQIERESDKSDISQLLRSFGTFETHPEKIYLIPNPNLPIGNEQSTPQVLYDEMDKKTHKYRNYFDFPNENWVQRIMGHF